MLQVLGRGIASVRNKSISDEKDNAINSELKLEALARNLYLQI